MRLSIISDLLDFVAVINNHLHDTPAAGPVIARNLTKQYRQEFMYASSRYNPLPASFANVLLFVQGVLWRRLPNHVSPPRLRHYLHGIASNGPYATSYTL